MVPGAFVVREAVPPTPDGTLDHGGRWRRRRPEAWSDVPRLERVGRARQPFRARRPLAADPAAAVHVRDTLHPHLSIPTVFSTPSLKARASEIERGIHEDAADKTEDEAERMAESNPVAGV